MKPTPTAIPTAVSKIVAAIPESVDWILIGLFAAVPVILITLLLIHTRLRKKALLSIPKCSHENTSFTITPTPDAVIMKIIQTCKDCGVTAHTGYALDPGVKDHKDYGYSENCGCMVMFFAASNYETSHFIPAPDCRTHTARFSTKDRNAFLDRARKSRTAETVV